VHHGPIAIPERNNQRKTEHLRILLRVWLFSISACSILFLDRAQSCAFAFPALLRSNTRRCCWARSSRNRSKSKTDMITNVMNLNKKDCRQSQSCKFAELTKLFRKSLQLSKIFPQLILEKIYPSSAQEYFSQA
jgi:hypothetical protein